MSFFKKVWEFITSKPDWADSSVFIGADVPIIIQAGEPVCTIVIEGAGSVDVKNSEDTKSS
jgi:hypothetical protein